MSELVSYMFISLDGFIADAGGGLEWTPIDEELMGFANDLFSEVDGIVFGRNVYEGSSRTGSTCRATRRRRTSRSRRSSRISTGSWCRARSMTPPAAP